MQEGNEVRTTTAALAVVETHARLHLGFLDLNFGLGRSFGSLGLAIERPLTRVRLRASATRSFVGPDAERAAAILEKLEAEPSAFSLEIEDAIPPHSGLGSGTQLALAVGAALQALRGERVDARAISEATERGVRSGIGIGVFEQGGFLVDGGRAEGVSAAPIVARMEFPEDWRILLVFDNACAGVHGEEERQAFARIPPASDELAGEFCRRTLMQILPALAENDLAAFSGGIRAIQDGMGDYFAPYQGGSAFRSPRVRDALAWLNAEGIKGTGQSSWGPTGFGFLTGAESATLLRRARDTFAGEESLSFDVVKGCNRPASVLTSDIR